MEITTSTVDARLAELLAEQAYREGAIVLSSGRESDFYLDAKQVTYHPAGVELVGQAVLQRIGSEPIDAVGGPTLGADAIVVSTVLAARREGRSISGFIVRKEPKRHGLARWIEGVMPLPGARVAIVEDIATSGASALKAAGVARDQGLEVAVIVPLVDREEGAAEAIHAAGHAFRPVLTITQIRDAARRLRLRG